MQTEKKETANEMKTEFSKAEQDCSLIASECNRERKAKVDRAETKSFSLKQAVKGLAYIKEGNSEKTLGLQKTGSRN